MRTLLCSLSIPVLLLAGAARADKPAPVRQCPAPWVQARTETICRDEAGTCRAPTFSRAAFAGANGREDHVLSKAEVRAELDAIRVAEPVQLAARDR